VITVPQRIICSNCGFLLYSGFELKPPEEIIQQKNGVCPNCGKKLNFEPENMKIIPKS
jgi:ribosomal protein S27AE